MAHCKVSWSNCVLHALTVALCALQWACTTPTRPTDTTTPNPALNKPDPIAAIIAGTENLATSTPTPTPNQPLKPAPQISATESTVYVPPLKLQGRWVSVPWQQLPAWHASDIIGVRKALLNHCQWLLKKQDLSMWQAFCASVLLEQDPRQAMLNHLQAYQPMDDNAKTQGLATGYYEPVLPGSLQKEGPYQWPLYGVPSRDQQLPRAQLTPVDGNVHPSLAGRELVWLADAIDSYVVHVQGSTRVQLPNGNIIRLAFAGTNGQPFSSISNPLIQAGVINASEASNNRLRQWSKTVPVQDVRQLLNSNARFVYFKRDTTPADVGPAGSIGVPLTPLRSVAVDPSFTPMGGLVWLDTPALSSPQLMLAQDTGSAIRGVSRVDIYYGTGDAAGEAASKTKHPSRLWVLWPKDHVLTAYHTP